jgi:hypothetical protein
LSSRPLLHVRPENRLPAHPQDRELRVSSSGGLAPKARRTLPVSAWTIPTTCPGGNSRRSARAYEEGRPVGRPSVRGALQVPMPELRRKLTPRVWLNCVCRSVFHRRLVCRFGFHASCLRFCILLPVAVAEVALVPTRTDRKACTRGPCQACLALIEVFTICYTYYIKYHSR